LGNHDRRHRIQAGLQGAIGTKGTRGRQDAGPGVGPAPLFGFQHRAGVSPIHLQILGPQEARPELRRNQLAGRHHPCAGPVADLTDKGNSSGDVPELGEITLHLGAEGNPQLFGQACVTLLDGSQIRLVLLRERGIEQFLESVGNAGDGGVNDQHACAAIEAAAGYFGRCCASWRAMKRWCRQLQNYPRRRRARHGLFPRGARNGGLPPKPSPRNVNTEPV